MTVQDRNSEQINLLRGEFQGRYEPQFAAMGISGRIMQLAGLRGYWPMSSVDASGGVYDESANGNNLTNTNTATLDYDGLVPYAEFDGTNYFTIGDNALLSILGTESFISSPGLTLGGWFWVDAFVNNVRLMAKDVSPNISYALRMQVAANESARFEISTDGANTTAINGDANLISLDAWYFIVGRFTPSTEVKLWINSDTFTNVTSIPASIFDGASAFNIGSNSIGNNDLTGRASNCWICAAALSDSIINNMLSQDKAAYGVE